MGERLNGFEATFVAGGGILKYFLRQSSNSEVILSSTIHATSPGFLSEAIFRG